jgi:anhydro-N-acetylmuramic acid kinase
MTALSQPKERSKTRKIWTVIGLMSGTSLDGVDAALLRTDGVSYLSWDDNGFVSIPYNDQRRADIRSIFGGSNAPAARISGIADDLTADHAAAIAALLEQTGLSASDIDLIGFHGQTIDHKPDQGFTTQIGNASMLARRFCVPVVSDFRSRDVANGGQGAPLIPLYHEALVRSAKVKTPVAVLNLGGVGNITYVGAYENDLLAFDTGPANALIDDAVLRATGDRFDTDGQLAKSGKVHQAIVDQWLNHPYFHAPAPKSLDRNAFDVSAALSLPLPDRIATITAFTVQSVALALQLCPARVNELYVCGGGRHNAAIMDGIAAAANLKAISVDALGWQGDALEAQGFAYLAVRSRLHLPLSLPTTTGVREPLTGGAVTIPPGNSMDLADTGI